MSSLEPRILTVERRLKGAEVAYESARRQVMALLQGERDTEDVLSAAPCSITVTVTVRGCNSVALSGATVALTGTAVSGTTNGSGQVTLSASGYTAVGGNTTVAYTVTQGSTRIASGGDSLLIACGGSGSKSTTLLAAGGFTCGGGTCVYPWKSTLTLTDPNFGTATTLTFGASLTGDAHTIAVALGISTGSKWVGQTTVNFAACAGCAAHAGVTVFYLFDGVTCALWYGTTLGTCPKPPPSSSGGNVNFSVSSCPPSAAPPQTYTLTQISANSPLYCNAAAVGLTIAE